jgi:putative colanic acid biosynthesis glycosyltransferase
MVDLSIITVCKDDIIGLKKTVQSISTINFKTHEIEVVIVDGGSQDGTKEYLRNLKSGATSIHSISEMDSGIYAAMNKGVRASRGKWVIFLNAGDEFIYEGDFDNIIQSLCTSNFMTAFSYQLALGDKRRLVNSKYVSEWNLKMPTSHQAMIFQREDLVKYPFREDLKICGDYDSFLKLYRLSGKKYECRKLVIARFYIGGVSTHNLSVLHSESLSITRRYSLSKYRYLSRKVYFSVSLLRAKILKARLSKQ